MQHFNSLPRGAVSLLLGWLAALLEPALPYMGICTLAVFYDCYSAWSLGRRVRRANPQMTTARSAKLRSHRLGAIIVTLAKAYALVLLAHLVDIYITGAAPVSLAKVCAGAICFWQLWSVLENESSCNGARWARLAQRVLIDKTARHFDINLDSLRHEKD